MPVIDYSQSIRRELFEQLDALKNTQHFYRIILSTLGVVLVRICSCIAYIQRYYQVNKVDLLHLKYNLNNIFDTS
jgi:hypothetical protein